MMIANARGRRAGSEWRRPGTGWPGTVQWLLGLCVLVLLVLGAAQARAQTDDPVAEVAGLSGPAAALRDAGAVALRVGAPIYRDDRLRTLPGARLWITFADGSELVLGGDSKVAVARYQPEHGRTTLDLLRGILRATVTWAAGWRSFDVETRSAVASARSTEWVVVWSEDGTAVFVVDGEVSVAGAGARVRLGPGDGTDVPPGAAPGAPKQWGQARVDAVLARTARP